MAWPSRVRVYDDGTEERTGLVNGLVSGSKGFRSLLVPDSAGTLVLPALRWPVYDIDRREIARRQLLDILTRRAQRPEYEPVQIRPRVVSSDALLDVAPGPAPAGVLHAVGEDHDEVVLGRLAPPGPAGLARLGGVEQRPDRVVEGGHATGLELAGPEVKSIAAFVQRALAAAGDKRTVVADSQARYFGALLDARGLNPDGADPRIGPTRFEDWLKRSTQKR